MSEKINRVNKLQRHLRDLKRIAEILDVDFREL